jgi:protein SCO1/2
MQATLGTNHLRNSKLIEKLVLNKFFWIFACSFFFLFPLLKSVQRDLPADLPVLSQVPEFRFIDENGTTFGSHELKGKVYIANFLFTSCQTACPVLLKTLQQVQHRMRGVVDRAAIVSFTVDPQNDTPKVLYEKAREFKANPHVWRFLTSHPKDVRSLLVEGFKVPMGEKEFANNVWDVAHSNKLVLVDQYSRIRGYYSADKDGVNQLMIDVGLVINKLKVN